MINNPWPGTRLSEIKRSVASHFDKRVPGRGLLPLLLGVESVVQESRSRPGNRCNARRCRGKSGLRRTGRQVTPGGCEPMESATENKPPGPLPGKGEKVR